MLDDKNVMSDEEIIGDINNIFGGIDTWNMVAKIEEVKDEEKINSTLENSTAAINLEQEKFIFGKNTINLILKRQKNWMIFFIILAVILLGSSFQVLKYLIQNEASDATVIVAFIGIILEIVAMFSIMVKYTFSSHTDEFVRGIYNHNHFVHTNGFDEQNRT